MKTKNICIKTAALCMLLVLSMGSAQAKPKDKVLNTDTAAVINNLLTDVSTDIMVSSVTKLDEAGDTLRNEDGTPVVCYYLTDSLGCVYDMRYVETMLELRKKSTKKVFKTIAAAAGIAGGLQLLQALASGDNVADALVKAGVAAGVGICAGVALSIDDISKICSINKKMRKIRKTLDAYKETFTVEGLPKDATADLTDVDGIDFTDGPSLSKTDAEVMAEAKASKEKYNLEELMF